MVPPALIRAAQKGDDEAKAQVIASLEGLIYTLATKRMASVPALSAGYTDRLEDLRQEGRLAVLECLQRYDANGGAKFSTYAHKRITEALAEEANDLGSATVSPAAVSTFKAALGQVGGDWEAAEFLVTVIDSCHRMSAAKAHTVRLVLEGVVSLDAPAGDGETFPLHDSLADPYGYGVPEDLVEPRDVARRERAAKQALAHALLARLKENPARVVRMTYGFEPEVHLHQGYDAQGLPVPDSKAIAEELGTTPGNVRVMLTRSLAKLRQAVESVAQELDLELEAVA
ncbi:sigma-70 family RNA polymerase sigma factor [Streptomyces sp. NPDC045470]|uniref:sigma-70 family RNA polymerase sigma factor n=1 Tax=Streptomyces sp. NPDC045470 TaxID=3155469 RepID=UPI0033D88D51